MMNSDFIVSLNAFLEIASKIGELRDEDNCSKCAYKRRCELDNKAHRIDSLTHMDLKDSRFSKMLKKLKKNPNVFEYVPANIYRHMYGLPLKNIECQFRTKVIHDNLSNISKVYELLEDDESKRIFLNVLMYRLTMNSDYSLRAYSSEPQYFIKQFQNQTGQEVFVDCGAYNGDSFCSYCCWNELPRAAYLFEPDPKNCLNAERRLAEYCNRVDLHIVNKGISDCSEIVFFVNGRGQGSYTDNAGNSDKVLIEMVSIDDSINENCSFIKMDIEGSERKGLIGAKKQIVSAYPKLAICVYHRTSDLWEIPLMIRDMFPKYNHYMIRHHSKYIYETVLYVYA